MATKPTEARRFTAKELRAAVEEGPAGVTPDMLIQAAEDAEVLQRLEHWFGDMDAPKAALAAQLARIREEVRA